MTAIEMDTPPAPLPRRSWRGLVWAAAGLLALGLVSAMAGPRPQAAAAVKPVAHEIGFQVQGDGRADFAGVWTRTQVIRYVPSSSSSRYDSPIAAVLTVRSTGAGQVWCRILLDGAVVDEQVAGGGTSSTCVWATGQPSSQTRSTE